MNQILILFSQTCQTKCLKSTVIPGISDHDCPLVEFDARPLQRKQSPRKVPIYKRADWESFDKDLKETSNNINELPPNTPVNDLWKLFKNAIFEGIEKHIPIKQLKVKDSLSYVTTEILKLMKRRDRLYKNRKKKQRNFDFSTSSYKSINQKLKDIRREIQQKTRQAYWKYIETIITPEETPENQTPYSNMKRFWAFIKQKRKDYTGIPTLYSNEKKTLKLRKKKLTF